MRGLLDYALVADDCAAKLFVRDAYDWARQHGIHRLGLFPTAAATPRAARLPTWSGLAVALTDAGLGDYWDDVEQYARNGLVEAQATDRDEMVRVSEAGKARPKDSPWGGHYDWRFGGNNKGVLKGQETTDRVIERSLGTFGSRRRARATWCHAHALLHRQRGPGPVLCLGGDRPWPRRHGGGQPVAQPPLALVRRVELAALRRQARGPEQGDAAARDPQARLGAAATVRCLARRPRSAARLARQPHGAWTG